MKNNNILKIFYLSLFTFVMFTVFSPEAFASTNIGYTSIGASTQGSQNRLRVSRVTVPTGGGGVVSQGSMYMAGSANDATVYMIAYSGSGTNAPTSLLGVSNGVSVLSTAPAGWVNFTFPTPFSVSVGQDIWIGLYADIAGTTAGTNGPNIYYSGSVVGNYASDGYRFADLGNAPVPSTFPAHTDSSTQLSYSAYLTSAPASATTIGNSGYSYNYFYSYGTVTNNTGSSAWYGTAWGAGAGYSGTACSALPNKTDYTTISTGTNNFTVTPYVTASPNTQYYFCLYVKDSSNNYYYSSTTSTLTTPVRPAPGVNIYSAHTIDNTSAVLPAGVNAYGVSATGYFRYGTSNVACSSLPGTTTNASAGSTDGNLFPVSVQLTGLTANTTYYYCYQATTTQGTTYSTVNSFTTATSAYTGCSLFPGSAIASSADSTTVLGYLGSSKFKGTRVYQATVNGWTSSAFHTAANSQGATITLYKNGNNNKIFGGYNPQSWSSVGNWIPGAGAFLFSLSDGYKLAQVTYADFMAYGHSNYGPTFGGGHDIGMTSSTLNTQSAAATNAHTYESPASKGAFTYLSGGGGTPSAYNFLPTEIEVYKISICDMAGPTVTTNAASSITQTTATLNGTANPNGIASTGWFRYFTSNPGTCADSGGTRVPASSGTSLGSGSTGVAYSNSITGLTPGTTYYACAIASNANGTGVGSVQSFSTLTAAPTAVTTNQETSLGSYYATLNGSANPNNYASYGFFRVYTSNPGSCIDSGGTRYPTNQADDKVLGSGAVGVAFSHEVAGTLALADIDPGSTYYYCAFARNANGTTGGSSVDTFTTPSGPTDPCDSPFGGNHTVSGSCSFQGSMGGVDNGTGTNQTAVLTIGGNRSLTLNSGQQVAWGSISFQPGAAINLGTGGSLRRAPMWVVDADGDGIIAGTEQYIGNQPAGGVRRNSVASNYAYYSNLASSPQLDCSDSNPYTYRTVGSLVADADNDGYKTSAAASSQCVGASSTINGRTYYKNSSNAYAWLSSTQQLGGGATDCQDNPNGAPCSPVNSSGTNGTNPAAAAASTTQINLSWGVNSQGGAVPAASGYDVQICGLNDTTCASVDSTVSVSSATFSYNNTSLTCSTSPSYYYRVVAKSGNGNTNSNIFSGVTSTCLLANGSACSSGSQCQSGNCFADADNDGYAPVGGSMTCKAAPSAPGTDCYDGNAIANPSQTSYYGTHRGDGSYDYNCDGAITKDASYFGKPYAASYSSGGGTGYYYSVREYNGSYTCQSISSGNPQSGSLSGYSDSNTACGTITASSLYSDSGCTVIAGESPVYIPSSSDYQKLACN